MSSPLRRPWTPISPEALSGRLASWLADSDGITRVAIDGPCCARPERIAAMLAARLRELGRAVAHVRAADFWRDASLRLEYGRQDVDSFPYWLDADALRREVLGPAATDGRYLPSLRDPVSNRSTRAVPAPLAAQAVLLVSGELLLGRALPFERTVHLALSPAARKRGTPAQLAWTLPAFERYDADVRPFDLADVVVKLDDARHPAVRGLPAS